VPVTAVIVTIVSLPLPLVADDDVSPAPTAIASDEGNRSTTRPLPPAAPVLFAPPPPPPPVFADAAMPVPETARPLAPPPWPPVPAEPVLAPPPPPPA
jgi:hypothetical protein